MGGISTKFLSSGHAQMTFTGIIGLVMSVQSGKLGVFGESEEGRI